MRSMIPSGALPPANAGHATRAVAVPGVVAVPVARVPRAVWFALGGLGLLSAGLAGALVMQAAQPGPAAQAAPAAVLAQSQQQPTAVAGARAEQAPTASRLAAPAGAATPADGAGQPGGAAPLAVAQAAPARVAPCATCGTIEAVRPVQVQGEGSGLGAVAGGVAGAVVGNQFGGGNGKTALTVLGAVGGGFAGHEVEKRVRATTAYDVTVRMDDGSRRTLRRSDAPAVGARVTVQGNSLRLGTDQAARVQRAGA